MSLINLPQSALQTSTFLNAARETARRLRMATAEARTASILRRWIDGTETAPTETPHQSSTERDTETSAEETTTTADKIEDETATSTSATAQPPTGDTEQPDAPPSSDEASPSLERRATTTASAQRDDQRTVERPVDGSTAYQLYRQSRRLVTDSWLYQWLTAEPEPEVIVIDLRQTRTVGPILTVLNRSLTRLQRDLKPALPTATVTRFGFWLQGQIQARPIRAVSILLAVVANLGLLATLGDGGDPVTPRTFFLFAILLVAIRGFRSTTSWDEITATRWYQRSTELLVAAFEPPEPPEPSTRSEQQAGTPDTSGGDSRKPIETVNSVSSAVADDTADTNDEQSDNDDDQTTEDDEDDPDEAASGTESAQSE